ncbi:virulence factor TspB C-terminal domain-related protein [Pseudogulbenkiania sp. MAI-1]|uniref:virulence factor TspB C-terminal domain-related protein n=1 Tax=Pseudogulbenkiania sp. MAI-1 TaxID=990370 RepID=UPI00045EA6EF|nr:virulence factor TspB C-terminal domain-related protein [Pseudogulbenkiania sp. MAI-1]
MNRHLRNFAFFLLGFVATLLTGYASAGWTVNDGYSHSGGNLNRVPQGNATAGAGATATVNGPTVEVNRSWSQAMGDAATGTAAQVAVNVLSKIPKSGVVNAARVGMSVSPVGLAGSVLAQWLLQQGWEWSNEQWMKPAVAEQYSGTWRFMSNPIFYGTHDEAMAYGCTYYGKTGCWIKTIDSATAHRITWVGGGSFYVYRENDINPSSPKPATDADFLQQAEGVVNAQPADVLRELAQRNIELQDATNKIQQLADALSPQKLVGTGTKQNADGSTETYQLQEMLKWEIDLGERPAEDPAPVKESVIQTKTTNIYNTDNSVTTKTETNQTYKNSTAQQEQKTDCDKKPNSIGCSDWGDAPSGPEIGQQQINPTFSWSPFSLPSTCPAPQQLHLHFATVAMTWQPSCDFATGIRPIVIAFAGLAALYLMFGMKQDG